jgi:hypothetical protein
MKTVWQFALVAGGIVLLVGAQVMTDISTIAIYCVRSYVLHLPSIFITDWSL